MKPQHSDVRYEQLQIECDIQKLGFMLSNILQLYHLRGHSLIPREMNWLQSERVFFSSVNLDLIKYIRSEV